MNPRHVTERTLAQQVFIRCCRDSGFTLDAVRAAILAAAILDWHPLEIWLAMPSLGVMHDIATNNHPAARQ